MKNGKPGHRPRTPAPPRRGARQRRQQPALTAREIDQRLALVARMERFLKAWKQRKKKRLVKGNWKKAFRKELEQDGIKHAPLESLRQMMGAKKVLGARLRAVIMRLGPHKAVVIASAGRPKANRLLAQGRLFDVIRGRENHKLTLEAMSERELRHLVRSSTPRRTGRPPGGVFRWMEYLRRVHRDLVPAFDRLKLAHEKWLTQRFRPADTKSASDDLKPAELDALMGALADLLELVERTREQVAKPRR